MAEGVQVFGDIAQSIRKRPGLWLAGGALAVGLGVLALYRDRTREEPVLGPSPDNAPGTEALEGLAGSIQAQSQAILTAISQLSETQAQSQALLLETLAAQQEAQLEAQTRFWAEFQQAQEQRQTQILQAFQQQSQALSEAISGILDAIRERLEPPTIEIPRSPEPQLLPVPYGPAVGYGLTWEPGEGPPPPTIEQIKSDPKLLAMELERTRLVIENRRRLGMPTEDQERRLQTLLNLQQAQQSKR